MINNNLDLIQLNDDYSKVIEVLGEPLGKMEFNENDVYRYGSQSSLRANFVYLKDGKVVAKSVSIQGDDKTLEMFIQKYGAPAKSFPKYTENRHDSFSTTMHVWPDKGIELTTFGFSQSNTAVRIKEFAPLSLDEYFQSWGKNEINNSQTETTAVIGTPTPTPSISASIMNNKLLVAAIAFSALGLALLFILSYKFFLKRKRETNAIPSS